MPRRNHVKSRYSQTRRNPAPGRNSGIPRIEVETMVIPRGRCPRSGKLRFSAEEAEKALHQARASRERRGSGHAEERVYHCDVCGDHHLTSRKTWEQHA